MRSQGFNEQGEQGTRDQGTRFKGQGTRVT
jgi:hypothetical protein